MQFLNEGHRARYQEAMDRIGCFGDSGWAAFLFLMTVDERWWTRIQPAIDWSWRGIDARKARKLGWSRSELYLVELALYLFNGSGRPDHTCLWESLDMTEFGLAMQAIRLKRAVNRGVAV